MAYRLLVGSYTSDVTLLEFDSDARTLRVASALTVGYHPSWLTRHPSDPSLVYTGLEEADGKILALNLSSEGTISVVGEASSGGEDPASLVALEKELIVGNVRVSSTSTEEYAHDTDSTRAEISLSYPFRPLALHLLIPRQPLCTNSRFPNRDRTPTGSSHRILTRLYQSLVGI